VASANYSRIGIIGLNLSPAAELSDLGTSQLHRFEHVGKLTDLEDSILNLRKIIEFIGDGHPDRAKYLCNLGRSKIYRFEHFGDLADVEDCILVFREAVDLTEDGHPIKATCFANLGYVQWLSFDTLGNLADLEESISNLLKAVELRADDQPEKAFDLCNLGNSLQCRFERLGELNDLEDSLLYHKHAVQLTSDNDPDKPGRLSNLGVCQHYLFARLTRVADLEDSISNLQNAVDLADEDPDKPEYFSNLSISQGLRFEQFGDLADLDSCISNLRKAICLTDGGYPHKAKYLNNLGNSHHLRFNSLGETPDLEISIIRLQEAVELTDNTDQNKPQYLSNLGNCQRSRFERFGELTDLENSISNSTRAIELTSDGHPRKGVYLSNLGNSQLTLFERLSEVADCESSIKNLQNAVKLTCDGQTSRPGRLSSLGLSQLWRFKHLGDLSDLENSILNLQQAVVLTNDGHPVKAMYLSNLGIAQYYRFRHLGEPTDAEDSMSNTYNAVGLTPDGHPQKSGRLLNLGICHLLWFMRFNDLNNLETSILNLRKALELSDDRHPSKAMYFANLGIAQKYRFECLRESHDLLQSMSAFQAAAELPTAYPHLILFAAKQWAEIAYHSNDIPFALEGYRNALRILPKVAWLGLCTTSRQEWLSREKSEHLGSLAARCAIQLGHFEEAVELLDVGRSVFWQQASSLRHDLETLREEEPDLAKSLEEIGRQLDAGNFSVSTIPIGEQLSGNEHHSQWDVGRGRRDLVGIWEGLLERVRQLPKFEHFLRPIPIQQLRQNVTTGQVVIINVCQYGVDALIFAADGPIEHVSLLDVDFDILTQLSGDIVNRPVNTTDAQRRSYTNHYLIPALRTVWADVVVPIFNKAQISLEVSLAFPQHRIWWYTTGPLTFIPIHAAGPGKNAVDVSRLVISSHLTTLASFFQMQEKNRLSSTGRFKFLSISLTDTPGQSCLPQTRNEVRRAVEIVRSAGCSERDIVRLNEFDATIDRVLSALETCSWAHFACHGMQDPILGMKSAFALHDGELELGQIASRHLSNAQFAFLSVCNAATGLRDLPGEAMHLAAGLQFTGFQSVIASMWSVSDADAPIVADHTYKYLFRNGFSKCDPTEAATALNRAVSCLREDPEVTLERWIPFIHFGI
jgi:tetratricopeptide (TPR) repeat protein